MGTRGQNDHADKRPSAFVGQREVLLASDCHNPDLGCEALTKALAGSSEGLLSICCQQICQCRYLMKDVRYGKTG